LYKYLLINILFCVLLSANDNNNTSYWTELPKTQKLVITNVALASGLVAWGYSQWGYGEEDFHTDEEGWFEKDTSNGGSDKLGHFYTNYLITRILSPIYEDWGYSNEDAALYASLSSIFFSGVLIEVGDGFSEHGFSKEDLIVDILGAGAGYLLATHPSLAKKIDFRVEYNPFLDSENVTDFSTDYERMKHLVAIKAEGFEVFEDNYMKYLELQIGYYTRNFNHNSSPIEDRERYMYVGIGINLSKILRPAMGNYSKIFNYYQVPYTYIAADKEF
jgi:hypothetical protein